MKADLQVTCPFCSLLCTDIRIIVDRGRLIYFTPECALGRAGFDRGLTLAKVEERYPPAADVERARAWMRDAQQPLVVISSSVDCEAVSSAVTLAKKFSTILTCVDADLESILDAAVLAAGMQSGTFGHFRDMDLVLLCGIEASGTHPRLNDFLTHNLAKSVQKFNPGDPLTAVRWLRLASANQPINLPEDMAFVSKRITESRQGLAVFASNWLKLGQPFIAEMLFWLGDLNRSGRWYALYLPPGSNSAGVEETLLSETGFAGNLRFTRTGLDHLPSVLSADRLIDHEMVDLCLFVGDPHSLSERKKTKLSKLRTILIGSETPEMRPDIWLPCAHLGISTQSTFLRLDGLPLKLNPILPSQRQSMAEILTQLTQGES